MAFVQRLISVQVDLSQGTFSETGTSTITLTGLRMSVTVTQPGIPEMARLSAQIFGMTLSQMNKLSTLGQVVTDLPRSLITVFAGDADQTQGVIFSGSITAAWADFDGAPDIPFCIEAQAGLIESVAPYSSTNPKGAVAASDLLSQFASHWNNGKGIPFVNYGVVAILTDPHLYGSLKNQIMSVLQQARAFWNGAQSGVFAVWPVNGYRSGLGIPTISRSSGMVGYPAFTQNGMIVRSIFSPDVIFGGLVKIKSSLRLPLTPNGNWQVAGLSYKLNTLTPRGDWFMTLNLIPPGYAVTPPL